MGPAKVQRAVRIHMTFMQTQLTQSTKENVYIVHVLAVKLYTYHHLSLNLTVIRTNKPTISTTSNMSDPDAVKLRLDTCMSGKTNPEGMAL